MRVGNMVIGKYGDKKDVNNFQKPKEIQPLKSASGILPPIVNGKSLHRRHIYD